MKAVLKFVTKDKTFHMSLSYNHRMVIGRGNNQEQSINDPKVSSSHCTLTLANEYLKIADNKSKNGTYLNGIRIDDAEMFIGDEIKIGDTIISLDEQRMEPKAVSDLTFPGPAKNRLAHELRVDFTGARIQNQLYNHANPGSYHVSTPSQIKEIDLRKKAQSRITLSKEEIKHRHSGKTSLARIIDTILLGVVFLAPIIYVLMASRGEGIPFLGMSAETVSEHKGNLIGASELVFTGLFFMFNMRLMDFSIGEQLSGIEKLYKSQG